MRPQVLARLLEKRFPPAQPGGPLRPEADTGAPPGMDLLKTMVVVSERLAPAPRPAPAALLWLLWLPLLVRGRS